MHWTKVYKLPEGSRTGKGRPIVNLIEIGGEERVSAIVPVRKFAEGYSLVMCTRKGTINKMDLSLFSRPRRAGINAITLEEGDELVSVLLAQEQNNLMIATHNGQAITFPPSAFRSMGRGTRGVRGIRLDEDDHVISMVDVVQGSRVLTLTENGYAKRTDPDEYRVQGRGGRGVRNVQITDKTGPAVFVDAVMDDYDLIISSREGQVIRISVDSIRITGRDAQGVRAINLRDQDVVRDAVSLPSDEDIAQQSEISQQVFAQAKEAVLAVDSDEIAEETVGEDPAIPNIEPSED